MGALPREISAIVDISEKSAEVILPRVTEPGLLKPTPGSLTTWEGPNIKSCPDSLWNRKDSHSLEGQERKVL